MSIILTLAATASAQDAQRPTPRAAVMKKRTGDATPVPLVMSPSRTERCSVSFTLPVGWVAEPLAGPPPPACSLGLLPPDYADFVSRSEVGRERYPITLVVTSKGVEHAAFQGGFAYRDGAWVVQGRALSESGTTRVEGRGWYGFLGEPNIGMHYKGGGYAGLGDTQRALLIGPTARCAVLDVTVIEYMPVFSKVLEAFEFSEAHPQ